MLGAQKMSPFVLYPQKSGHCMSLSMHALYGIIAGRQVNTKDIPIVCETIISRETVFTPFYLELVTCHGFALVQC
jgi:hypothetical protein